jgi:thioredoxin 1
MTESIDNYKLLLFQHDNCGICVALKPKIQELIASSFPGLQMDIIDLKKQPDMRGQHLVFTAPTLLFVQGAKEWFRLSGNFPLVNLKKNLSAFLPVTN